MSDITLNFVVDPFNTNFIVEQNTLNFTPEVVDLKLFLGGYATAVGNIYEVQYNAGGVLGASPNFIFNFSNSILTVNGTANVNSLNATGNITGNNITITHNTTTDNLIANLTNTATLISTINANVANFKANGTANLGNVSNVKILGGSNNYSLITDGTGNLSFGVAANANYAAYAGNVTIAGQPNITSLGNLTGLNVTGNASFTGSNVSLGNITNVKITGGTNGYVLQTDGTGNLTWTAQTGGNAGNGIPGGSNTQIQYNDSGSFGGYAGFTFDESTGNVNTPAHIIAVANVTANYFIGNGSQLTGISSFSISNGNSNAYVYANSNIAISIAGNSNIAIFKGTGANINGTLDVSSNITGSNLIGPISDLNYGTESVNLIGAQSGTYNFDLIIDAIKYSTSNANANLTLNFRGNSTVTLGNLLSNGQSIIGTYIMTTGSTPYGVTAIQIDGSSQTIKWLNNASPSQFANSITNYTFVVIKTSTTPTYTVLGSGARFA